MAIIFISFDYYKVRDKIYLSHSLSIFPKYIERILLMVLCLNYNKSLYKITHQ